MLNQRQGLLQVDQLCQGPPLTPLYPPLFSCGRRILGLEHYDQKAVALLFQVQVSF